MEKSKRQHLRTLNQEVWNGKKDVFPLSKSQDSSMKKNTAFIKRLRTSINATNVSTFTQEVASLSLHKYLSEIISACYEGLCKPKVPADIAAGVEIVSALHQRFGPSDFTGYLGWLIGRGLVSPDKSQLKALAPDVREREERDRLTRQRSLLRMATELWLAGVLRSLNDVVRPEFETKGKEPSKIVEPLPKIKNTVQSVKSSSEEDPFPLEVLKDLLGHDREHINLPLVVIFVKAFAWDVLGIRNQSEKLPTNGNIHQSEDDTANEPSITSPDMQERFKNVLTKYFDSVKAHLVKDQHALTAQAKRNAEAYVRSGEVFEDRQATFDKQTKSQEKLISNAQVLAEILGLDMPDLKDKEDTTTNVDSSIGLVKAAEYLKTSSDGPGIWEDEDERRFYEGLPNLKDKVPAILFEEPKKVKDINEQVGKKIEDKQDLEQVKTTEIDEQSLSIANKSVGAQVDGLLARLPDLHSKEMADEFSMDFCFLNSKASRHRLIKSLQDIPKGRTDLLPFYARIVATLSRHMPDIGQSVISHLDDEFRSLQRRKSKEFLGAVRLLNIRYMAELTKFGIVPEHIIFHCLKVCLDDLSRANIEIMGNLMENCGRYLLRTADTSPRMISFMETLARKKGAQHLDQRERLILENAMYYVNPPERPAIEQKDRTPIELFVQKVLCEDMNKKTVERSIKQLRKLHWDEPEVKKILIKYLSRPWKVQYNHIPLLACVVSVLNRYHSYFGQRIMDELLESTMVGLQVNDVKYNQRRISQVKYVSELYVYKLVDASTIFDTLFKIIGFGYESGMPMEHSQNSLDQSHDYFRIRLICILMETCAPYLPKKKFNFFITFFQYYVKIKEPLSMDIEFAVQDAFAAISPELKLAVSLEEAGNALNEAIQQNYQLNNSSNAVDDEVEEDHVSDDGLDEEAEDNDDAVVDENMKSSDDEEEEEDESDAEVVEEEDQSDFIRQSDDRDPELDLEFDRELAKLMTDSVDSRKMERKTLFDVPLPMRKTQNIAGVEGQPLQESQGSGLVKFSLLTKRGNRQQTKDIDLPADSVFAVSMRNQIEAEKEEKKRLKDLVLNLDLRDDTESDGIDPLAHLLTPNHNVKAGRYEVIHLRSTLRCGNPIDCRYPLQSVTELKNLISPAHNVNATASLLNTSFSKATSCSTTNIIVSSSRNYTYNKFEGAAVEKPLPNPYSQPKIERGTKNRAAQRGRQLQVSDLDW